MLFRFTFWGTLLSMLAAAAVAQVNATQPNANSVNANSIVDSMLKAQQDNKARVKAFTVKRGYLLLDKQAQEKAKIVANISILPPDAKEYEIESSSGGMGEKILRDVLAKETESPKDANRKDLSRDNYDFKLLGQDSLNGRHCYLLGLNPKREEKDLLRGKLWVDAETYNILRIEGSLMKSPSWWIHDVNILMSFAEVDGMWLRTSTHAVANVRFKGKYVMDSRDLEYRFTQETAARQPVSHPRRANPAIFTGSAIRP